MFKLSLMGLRHPLGGFLSACHLILFEPLETLGTFFHGPLLEPAQYPQALLAPRTTFWGPAPHQQTFLIQSCCISLTSP